MVTWSIMWVRVTQIKLLDRALTLIQLNKSLWWVWNLIKFDFRSDFIIDRDVTPWLGLFIILANEFGDISVMVLYDTHPRAHLTRLIGVACMHSNFRVDLHQLLIVRWLIFEFFISIHIVWVSTTIRILNSFQLVHDLGIFWSAFGSWFKFWLLAEKE